MLRLQNGYVPVDWWRSNEYLKDRADACLACFARYWQAQSKVAAEEGIPVIDVFAAFHGANRDQNPAETGLIDTDGIHVNEAGAKYEADLYRQLGYAWWRP
jgi:lysophospholipase L1-like esterase